MVELYHGDCFEILKTFPENSIDHVICDLPYGVTGMNWDSAIPLKALWDLYDRVLKDNANVILFSSGKFTYKLYESNKNQYKYKLIWKKNVPTGMSSAKYRPMKYYEEILVFHKGRTPTYNPQMKERIGKGKECYRYNHYCGSNEHIKLDKVKKKYDPDFVQPSDVLEFNVVPNRKGKLHPTEKPVELMEWLVRTYTNENDVILDNCMGSGTTGVACQNLNRSFIGIEQEEKYFKTTKFRLDKIEDNKTLPDLMTVIGNVFDNQKQLKV